jgi:hypothetical protein
MRYANELETSPRSARVHGDRAAVDIVIYRGLGDPDWVLEIVDEEGGATVWRRPFPTDDAAYAAAVHTIATEGIGAFTPRSEPGWRKSA